MKLLILVLCFLICGMHGLFCADEAALINLIFPNVAEIVDIKYIASSPKNYAEIYSVDLGSGRIQASKIVQGPAKGQYAVDIQRADVGLLSEFDDAQAQKIFDFFK